MKKILAMTLSVILCLVMSLSAFATEDVVTADTTDPEVYLDVDATGEDVSAFLIADTAVTDGVVTITYDTEAVSFDDADVMVSTSVAMYSINSSEEGTIRISWISDEAVTGTLFTFAFSRTETTEVTEDSFALEGTVTDEEGTELSIGLSTSVVDKSVLQALHDESQELTEESYTEESWAAYETAQAAAAVVLQDAGATQEEVDAALAALTEAIAGLETVTPEEVDKSALEELYDSGLLLTEEDYTEESWADFEEALTAALSVLEDDEATEEDVAVAWDALVAAFAGLTKASTSDDEVDKAVLLLIYETGLKLTENSYTEESWADFEDALEAALAVLNDEDATQEEVDAALSALSAALEALEAAETNKEVLQVSYDAVANLDSDSYTEESWAALEEASAAALVVLNDEDATQEEIDAALEALLEAVNGLTLNTTEDDGSGSGSGSSTGDGSGDGSGSSTGDGSGDGSGSSTGDGSSDGSGSSTGDGNSSNGGSLTTGDVSTAVYYAIALIAAAGIVLIVVTAKRRESSREGGER